jgi:hypothetical protein
MALFVGCPRVQNGGQEQLLPKKISMPDPEDGSQETLLFLTPGSGT